jgi:hypothetical protein
VHHERRSVIRSSGGIIDKHSSMSLAIRMISPSVKCLDVIGRLGCLNYAQFGRPRSRPP